MFKTPYLLLATCLLLSACDSGSSASNGYTPPDLSDLKSYRTDSDYAEALAVCPGLYQRDRVCTIGELPPLEVDSSDIPTVDEIMSRVSVSHDWMGARFEQALNLLPSEIRTLSKPLAAIVIDDDVRPSFFLSSSGTIYLDPKYLWLTQAEKDTISDHEDFRGAYATQMTTLPAWRYVDNGNYAYSSNDATSRTEEDMVQSLARLLFHELAHANDFIETNRLASLSSEAGFHQLINPEGGQMSDYVQSGLPLTSETLLDYAAALYLGLTASVQTTSLRGSLAGASLESEGANATYAYTTRYEDFAMLVEETMMQRHYGFQRDTAFIEQEVIGVDSQGDEITEVVVKWGQRGRIGDALVKPRAQTAMEQLLPEIDWATHFSNLAAPDHLTVGDTWAENLSLSNDFAVELSSDERARNASLDTEDFANPHY
ncbi:MAG: hypothetical protein ACPGSC_13430 [Granulosicoccaceae bacterium]